MSNRASRQRRKAAMAAAPKITSKELIDLGLMNLEREFIVPGYMQDRPDDLTLMHMITEVKLRRAALFQALLDGSYITER
jgi:hypothetical protein